MTTDQFSSGQPFVPAPVMIGTFSRLSNLAIATAFRQGAAGSATWPSANTAIFVPFTNPRPELVKKLWSGNGSAVSGNIDVGIYDASGNRLVSSGSTAQAGTNDLQEFDVTDTVIPGPATLYLACALDNTTGQLFRNGQGSVLMRMYGLVQQTSAFPLPTTATFATIAQAYCPDVGASLRTLVQ